jgi:hypothetical protein
MEKVSYDDILNSLQVKIVNGRLVFNRKIKEEEEKQEEKIKKINMPLPQEVKNSKIFNKYFKNYKDENEIQEIKKPKSLEEYKQLILEEKAKRFLAQKRLERIKSTKLFMQPNLGCCSLGNNLPIVQEPFHFLHKK